MLSQPDQDPTWRVLLSAQYLPAVTVLSMAVWLHAANSMLTATTMPGAVTEIGGPDLLSWAFALYLTGSPAGVAIYARLDIWQRQPGACQ